MGSTDKDIYITIITVIIVLLILLIFIVSFLFIYKSRQVRHQTEMESVTEKYTQEILKTELEIKEQTLKKIAEEIHDNVGQVLSLAVLNLSAIEFDNPQNIDKIESITQLVQKAVSDLRDLSKTLDAEDITTLGLTSFIKFEMDLLEKSGVYKTNLEYSGQEIRLNGHKELIIYRIIQESLNNIVKHAYARCITVALHFCTDMLAVSITDDGIGFDIDTISSTDIHSTGAGLRNMKKRATLIGASITITSFPKKGTDISLIIPLIDKLPSNNPKYE